MTEAHGAEIDVDRLPCVALFWMPPPLMLPPATITLSWLTPPPRVMLPPASTRPALPVELTTVSVIVWPVMVVWYQSTTVRLFASMLNAAIALSNWVWRASTAAVYTSCSAQ